MVITLSVDTIEYWVTFCTSTHFSPVLPVMVLAAPSKLVAIDRMLDWKIRASSTRASTSAALRSAPSPTPHKYFFRSHAPCVHPGCAPPTLAGGPSSCGGSAGGG